MTRIPPPLLGYNNNVRYLGRTFHIQTEDSGTKYARIMTHLFVDGGRIVKSTRTEYGSVVGQPGMAETVRRMMKEQHKNMFLSLRAGEFDEIIDKVTSGVAMSNAPEPAISRVPQLRSSASLPPLSFGPGEEPKTLPGMSTLVIDRQSLPNSSAHTTGSADAGLGSSLGKRPSARPRKSSIPPASRRTAGGSPASSERASVKTKIGIERASVKPSGAPPEQRIAVLPMPSAAAAERPAAKPSRPPAATSSARIPLKPSRGPAPSGASSGRIPLKPSGSPSEQLLAKPSAASSERIPVKSNTAKDRPSERPSRRLVVRPPTQTQEAIDPRSQSIFGEATAGKQTLDEVILSFLEDEES